MAMRALLAQAFIYGRLITNEKGRFWNRREGEPYEVFDVVPLLCDADNAKRSRTLDRWCRTDGQQKDNICLQSRLAFELMPYIGGGLSPAARTAMFRAPPLLGPALKVS